MFEKEREQLKPIASRAMVETVLLLMDALEKSGKPLDDLKTQVVRNMVKDVLEVNRPTKPNRGHSPPIGIPKEHIDEDDEDYF